MSDKEERETAEETAGVRAAKKGASRGAGPKKATSKAAAGSPAKEKATGKPKKPGRAKKEEEGAGAAGGEAAAAPVERETGEAVGTAPEESGPRVGETAGEGGEEQRELSEEEMRRLIEEQLEKITVLDVVSQMMATLASLAYQRLGLPENVNLKYRDFAQARIAIDALKGLLSSLEGKLEESRLSPFRGTLANLQMNYVRLMKPGG